MHALGLLVCSVPDYTPQGTLVAMPWESGIGMSIQGTLTGVEASSMGQVYVGDGFNVAQEDGPGSEYYSSSTWSSSMYSSDSNRAADVWVSVGGLTVDDANPVAYRALVVEDSWGNATGSGVVSSEGAGSVSSSTTFAPTASPTPEPTPEPTAMASTGVVERRWAMSNNRPVGAAAMIGTYPDYSGSMSVTGTVYISNVYSTTGEESISIHGTLSGLEANAVGGIHVSAEKGGLFVCGLWLWLWL